MRKNKNSKQCSFMKLNGKRCCAWAMDNSEFCFTHNPETKDLRKEAVIKGGKGNKKETHSLDLIKVENSKDVVDLIVKTINELRTGLIDVRVANCTFYGSGQLIKALETSDLEKRLEEIEKILEEKK